MGVSNFRFRDGPSSGQEPVAPEMLREGLLRAITRCAIASVHHQLARMRACRAGPTTPGVDALPRCGRRICGWAAAASLAWALSPAHAQGWDAAAQQASTGTYAVACDNAAALHITVDRARVVAAGQGSKVEARIVDVAYSYFGQSAPRDFQFALMAQLANGQELTLLVFRDKAGKYVLMESDKATLARIGDRGDGRTRYRDCNAARRSSDGSAARSEARAAAGAEQAAANALPIADPRFARAYRAALGARAREPWLARMDGPTRGAEMVDVGGRRVMQYAFCKPHDCHDNNILVLYDASSGKLVGVLVEGGRQASLLGAPSPAMGAELGRRWRAEFRQGQ